ncbi:MAG: amidohydrolase family protein [Pseudomonadota bacterium]
MKSIEQLQNHHAIDERRLAMNDEPVLDAAQPIVDAHHHLWVRPPSPAYFAAEMVRDIEESGHDVRASVFAECRSMYRRGGEEELKPLGELEFANGVGAVCASGAHGPRLLCAGIVGFTDLRSPRAGENLAQMQARAPERFSGIRQIGWWHPDASVANLSVQPPPPQGLFEDRHFLAGMKSLGELGLSFDITVCHAQLDEALRLIDRFPGITFVITHLGGWVGVGPYAGRRDEEFVAWSTAIRKIGQRHNAYIKMGGIGMQKTGMGFHDRELPPSSIELAQAWRPFLECCIESFGCARAMFESNFPVDKSCCSYRVVWNTFKRVAGAGSQAEKDLLFFGAAYNAYRLHRTIAPVRS